MKISWTLGLAILAAAGACGAAEPAAPEREVLYQVATINALLAGHFDGLVACEELLRHGDLGLGTFHALDGEMAVLGGVVYQVRHDGSVVPVGPKTMTPFANVTFFEADQAFELSDVASLEQLQQAIGKRLVNRNAFYAIRVDGAFESVKVRSVPKQARPYPTLAEAVKAQSVFDLKDVQGTLLGFWCPDFAQALNVPGFHLHFLSEDRRSGGHVLNCCLREGKVRLDLTPGFAMQLPEDGFGGADLSGGRKSELEAVEKPSK